MKHSFKVGFSFGLTSGVITTLGLMVGLTSGTNSRLAVVGGILIIAIADSMSDALGIHMSEESENRHSHKEVWQSTISTFFSKLAFALTFVVPVFLFELSTAVIVSIIWGLSLIIAFSYIIASEQRRKPLKIISEHVFITILVVIITHYVGKWIALAFT